MSNIISCQCLHLFLDKKEERVILMLNEYNQTRYKSTTILELISNIKVDKCKIFK